MARGSRTGRWSLRSLLGDTDLPASAEEIAWGFRKLLEQEAQTQPLVCVFDDLHWADPTLLELVEHVADLSRDAPLLILCMARPELLERRPSWGGGKLNATTVLLEPLDAAETEQLIAELGGVDAALRDRILQVAEGNPLFLEEMLALVRDSGSGEVEVPPTIQALLAARLDQLDPAERSVLEHGSVEGRVFHRGAVAALGGADGEVDRRLVALVRKELVRPDRAQLAGEDAYRFRHLLIRDAAYDALPKATRADLHRRFAAWLGEHGQTLVELDEIVGYHLEQAARYLDELGRSDGELALEAADRLALAGMRAMSRGDRGSTAALLDRSLKLSRPHRLDVHAELDLAWGYENKSPQTAASVAAAAAERATAAGDEAGAVLARVHAAFYRLLVGGSPDELEQLAAQALPPLEACGDHRGLAAVWFALGEVANYQGRYEDRTRAAEHAIENARLAGRPARSGEILSYALVQGPRPADEALETLDRLIADSEDPRVMLGRAHLLAMLDRLDEAWTLSGAAEERLRELGQLDEAGLRRAEIAVLAGDHERAVAGYRLWCEALESSGRTAELSTYAPTLARLLSGLGRDAEAEPLAEKGRELGDPSDVATQISLLQAEALLHSGRGEHAAAAELARQAVEWSARCDSLFDQGDSFSTLARVLEAASCQEDAIAAWRDALDRYERKRIVPLARRTRERLAALQSA
jgi:tetratricopeptide (TPR) repeat protein